MHFSVEMPVLKNTVFRIEDYGAVNGGRPDDAAVNQKAIQTAIDEANANGGGKVIVPAGIWLTSPIELKSNVNLHIETGAILFFDKRKEAYPLYISDYEGMETIYAQNGDGLDLESCKYALITGTTFDVGDDAICMKSGKGKKAREIQIPTEYVEISDCTVYHGHGGFVVGSEMSRGVRHVSVHNCTFIGTDVGIRFKSALGRGGIVEDISLDTIQNVTVSPEDVPYFRNIMMTNITCNGAKYGLKVEGIDPSVLPNKDSVIDNIYLKDSLVLADVDTVYKNAGNIVCENVIWS